MKRVYILDKLHALGHYTIGYSGMPPEGTQGWSSRP